MPPDILTATDGELIVALAARHRLPAVYAFGYLVSAGGVMSYGTGAPALLWLPTRSSNSRADVA